MPSHVLRVSLRICEMAPLDYVVCHNPVDLVDTAGAWSMWAVASDPEMDPWGLVHRPSAGRQPWCEATFGEEIIADTGWERKPQRPGSYPAQEEEEEEVGSETS